MEKINSSVGGEMIVSETTEMIDRVQKEIDVGPLNM
jgi:hypothetical protein